MKHLSIAELSTHLDRALTGRALEEVERHLAGCAACRAALDEIGRASCRERVYVLV